MESVFLGIRYDGCLVSPESVNEKKTKQISITTRLVRAEKKTIASKTDA
jgi:hypothetical protein